MITTDRLYLIPLTYNQLLKYIRNDYSLESELKLKQNNRTIPDELKEALEKDILPKVTNEITNSSFVTLWTIISKEHNCMVGDFCFTGLPNKKGEVELGYGIYNDFQGQGFMSEAVGGIIDWLKKQNDIKTLIAHTDTVNVSSHRVLIKNNFNKVNKANDLYMWELNV